MSTETFEVPLDSAERWADDVMGLVVDLSAICASMGKLGVSVRGLDPQFDSVLRMTQDARRIASDLLLDLAGHGILPAEPPGDFEAITADVPPTDELSALPTGRRRISAEQILAMSSIFAVTDGDEAALTEVQES